MGAGALVPALLVTVNVPSPAGALSTYKGLKVITTVLVQTRGMRLHWHNGVE
jgi:hypothetical protein